MSKDGRGKFYDEKSSTHLKIGCFKIVFFNKSFAAVLVGAEP